MVVIDWYLSVAISAMLIGIIVAVATRRMGKVVGAVIFLVGLVMTLMRLAE